MKFAQVRGWDQAVRRAKELWPEIPGWAYELAAEETPPETLRRQADLYPIDPENVGEVVIRLACARGWTPRDGQT